MTQDYRHALLHRVLNAHQDDLVREFDAIRETIGASEQDTLDSGALWRLRSTLLSTLEVIDSEIAPAAGITHWPDAGLEDAQALDAPTGNAKETATAPERPPACVDWVDEDRGILKIEAARPLIHWLQEEADEASEADDLEHYILTTLYRQLEQDLMAAHGQAPDIEMEVPPEFAQRVAWYAEAQRLRGNELSEDDLRVYVLNHLQNKVQFTLAGEPWQTTTPDAETNGAPDSDRAGGQ